MRALDDRTTSHEQASLETDTRGQFDGIASRTYPGRCGVGTNRSAPPCGGTRCLPAGTRFRLDTGILPLERTCLHLDTGTMGGPATRRRDLGTTTLGLRTGKAILCFCRWVLALNGALILNLNRSGRNNFRCCRASGPE